MALSHAEAAARLQRYGPNSLQAVKPRPLILTFLANFSHLMALLLWVGGLIGFIAQLPQLGIAIWMVNLINGLFSFWQEYRAERAAAALRALLPSLARVLRDGDDNFATIVNAIAEGRAVYASIRKFVNYIFTSNMPEAVPFVLFALSGGRIPLGLTVMQVLVIDLGTDMLPALALGAEPAEPAVMDRPPRRHTDHIITRGLMLRVFCFLGLIQSGVAMLAFYSVYWSSGYSGYWLDLPSAGPLYQTATTISLAAIVATCGNGRR